MAQAETRQKLLQLGVEPQTAIGADLTRFVVAERDKWGGVIRSANIRVD
jgi:tripartite-type tricarboxylate transporter receptor subunit TctC